MPEAEKIYIRPDRQDFKKLARHTEIKLALLGFSAFVSACISLGLLWPFHFASYGISDWLACFFFALFNAAFTGAFIFVWRGARRNRDESLIVVFCGKVTHTRLEADGEVQVYRVFFGELYCDVQRHVARQCEVGKTVAIRLWERDNMFFDHSLDPEIIRAWRSRAITENR